MSEMMHCTARAIRGYRTFSVVKHEEIRLLTLTENTKWMVGSDGDDLGFNRCNRSANECRMRMGITRNEATSTGGRCYFQQLFRHNGRKCVRLFAIVEIIALMLNAVSFTQ